MRAIATVGLLIVFIAMPPRLAQSQVNSRIRAMFAADFNADLFPDLLAQAENGNITLSLNRGVGANSPFDAFFDEVPTPLIAANGCHVVGLADFNDDGLPDPVCQARNGAVLVWLNNGSVAPTRRDIYTGVSDWHIVAIADFDKNGTPDLIWQSPHGRVVVWLMQGTTMISAQDIWPLPSFWRVVGAGDFNRDGDADLLWQNAAGDLVMWMMHGVTLATARYLFTGGTAWRVIDVAPLTPPTSPISPPDLLWQAPTGQIGAWLLGGPSITRRYVQVLPNPLFPGWHLSTTP
jgi:hypothetical protein